MPSLPPDDDPPPLRYHYPQQYEAEADQQYEIEICTRDRPAGDTIKIPFQVNRRTTLNDLKMIARASYEAAPVNLLTGTRVLTREGEVLCSWSEQHAVRAWTGEPTIKLGEVAAYRAFRTLRTIQLTA